MLMPQHVKNSFDYSLVANYLILFSSSSTLKLIFSPRPVFRCVRELFMENEFLLNERNDVYLLASVVCE
jgi:hypothetical protein